MPFGVILACYSVCLVLLLIIRHVLARENKRRADEEIDAAASEKEGYDNVYVEVEGENGTKVRKPVDKVCVIC